MEFAIRRLEPEAFDRLHAYARSLGATLNDVFVAAYFRALWCFLGFPAGIPQSVGVPVNLRPYLASGKTQAICNFVAPLYAILAHVEDESFQGTLERLKLSALAAGQRKASALSAMLWITLLHHLFLPQVERAMETMQRNNVAEGRTEARLSNLGSLDTEMFDFGVAVTDAYKILGSGSVSISLP